MVESPCNAVCSIDADSGLCVSCSRTEEEIVNWLIYGEEQKKMVLENIKNRK